jgi:hypothetical protein
VGVVGWARPPPLPYLSHTMHELRDERAELIAAIQRGRCKAAFRHVVQDTTLPGLVSRRR